jgi:hypothetical protein
VWAIASHIKYTHTKISLHNHSELDDILVQVSLLTLRDEVLNLPFSGGKMIELKRFVLSKLNFPPKIGVTEGLVA